MPKVPKQHIKKAQLIHFGVFVDQSDHCGTRLEFANWVDPILKVHSSSSLGMTEIKSSFNPRNKEILVDCWNWLSLQTASNGARRNYHS